MSKALKILLTNDDGYDSVLLQDFAKSLRQENAQVCICAPLSNKSGAGSSISFVEATIVNFVDDNMRIIAGTPTDCVHLAFSIPDFLPWQPDITISGINFGKNLGNDVLYSGTIAAAAESITYGIPAIALSMAVDHQADTEPHYQDVIEIATKLVFKFEKKIKDNPKTLLNINIPDAPKSKINAIKVCPLGLTYPGRFVYHKTDKLKVHDLYRIGALRESKSIPSDSDYDVIHKKHITITPLKFDLTDEDKISEVNSWIK